MSASEERLLRVETLLTEKRPGGAAPTKIQALHETCRQFAVENDLVAAGYNTEQGVVALLSKELMSRPSVDAETKRAIVEALHMERG